MWGPPSAGPLAIAPSGGPTNIDHRPPASATSTASVRPLSVTSQRSPSRRASTVWRSPYISISVVNGAGLRAVPEISSFPLVRDPQADLKVRLYERRGCAEHRQPVATLVEADLQVRLR